MTSAGETWDAFAASFDDEPDHGLRDPIVNDAWTALLRDHLPSPPARILDVGCGTGSLTLAMSELGHRVVGIDVSPRMLARAEEKLAAAGFSARFRLMDADDPHLDEGPFDVVLARHVLWLFPEPRGVVERWLGLVRPGGRLVLIEGYWHTGVGLHGQDVLTMLASLEGTVNISSLTGNALLWGKPVTDERYVITFDRST